jgi:hypothetical protein
VKKIRPWDLNWVCNGTFGYICEILVLYLLEINYVITISLGVLYALTLCLFYLNPYCMGRIAAFFQWVFKFTYYDKSALERLEGQATVKF